VEIIVVDNFSTDVTPEIAARYADLCVQIGPERCAQRNAGLLRSGGKFVVFIDSDMYLPSDAIATCVTAMKDGVVGVILPERSIGDGFWSACKAFERSFYLEDTTVTAARFYRRDLLLEIGGYDERLVAGEDWDLSMRAEVYGTLVFADSTVVHDEGRIVLLKQFRKKFYYGSTLGRFILKHGVAARAKLSPARTSLIPAFARMFEEPKIVLGTVLLKLVDLSGITSGILFSMYRYKHSGGMLKTAVDKLLRSTFYRVCIYGIAIALMVGALFGSTRISAFFGQVGLVFIAFHLVASTISPIVRFAETVGPWFLAVSLVSFALTAGVKPEIEQQSIVVAFVYQWIAVTAACLISPLVISSKHE